MCPILATTEPSGPGPGGSDHTRLPCIAVRPRIGIALTLDAQLRAGRSTWFADAAYGAAAAAAGGLVHYIAASGADAGDAASGAEGELPVDLDAALAVVDGLVIPGGDDFLPPTPYPPSVAFRAAAPAQIARDLALVRAALARRVPLLGICYGMQLLALASGGALVYDIPHELPGAAQHRLAAHERHTLALVPGSRLAAIFGGARELAVNSRHHQVVAAPGAQLVATAHARDGVIEAIESPAAAPFALGLQWHPEDMDAAHALRVYGALVAAARDSAKRA